MTDKNVFETRSYSLKEFQGDMDELKKHLEYKINAVIFEHKNIWNIDNIQRNISSTTASAKIFMTRK